ncbi:unnamed protein product [Blepharisma stoltei]|uniref:Uncharacterized protein n=1 Tax=Blepharisma stoltei TaxID=1481888 RepID=A0AAU9JKH6_9CILI|nr:unnamed protein product [Blepharisma stoltei]
MGGRNAKKKKEKQKQQQQQKNAKTQAVKKPKILKIIEEPAIVEKTAGDGGTQGSPSIPIYMDEEGDIGNEFYIESNGILTKVREELLIKIR